MMAESYSKTVSIKNSIVNRYLKILDLDFIILIGVLILHITDKPGVLFVRPSVLMLYLKYM